MKKFFDDWFAAIAILVALFGLAMGLACCVNWILIHDLKVDLKSYQDFHECIINGVEPIVCEIQFIK